MSRSSRGGFHGSVFVSMGGVDYMIGSFFFLLAIFFAMFIKKAKKNLEIYKAEQLVQYNKNHPKSQIQKYENTKLYVPFWQRTKANLPWMFVILFVIVGITWMVGRPIQTL